MAAGTGKRSILIEVLGDYKNFIAGGTKAELAAKSFENKLQAVGRALTLAYGAKKVVDFARDAVQAAQQDAAAQALLADQLRTTTGATNEQIKAIEQWITKTSHATGFLDDQMRPSLATFVRVTNDATKAQELMTIAMDVARGTGQDLESVSAAIAKAYGGNTTALGRMIPGLKAAGGGTLTWAAAQEKLNAQFGGRAAVFASTTEGKLQRLNAQWQDMKETVGQALVPAVTQLVGVLSTAFSWFNNLNENQQQTIVIAGMLAAGIYVGVSAFNALHAAVTALGLTMGSVTPWLVGAAVAVGAIVAILGVFGDSEDQAAEANRRFDESARQATSGLDLQRLAFLNATDAAIAFANAVFQEQDNAVRKQIEGSDEMVAALQHYGWSMEDVIEASRNGVDAMAWLGEQTQNNAKFARDNASATDEQRAGYLALQDMMFKTSAEMGQVALRQAELARTGDRAAIAYLKASGNMNLLSGAEQKEAEAALAAAAAADKHGTELDDTNSALTEAIARTQNLLTLQNQLVNASLGLEGAYLNYQSSLDNLNTTQDDASTLVDEHAQALLGAKNQALAVAAAAADQAKAQAEANGTYYDANAATQTQIGALQHMADELAPGSELRVFIEGYIADLKKIPTTIGTTFKLDGPRASISRGPMQGYASGTRNARRGKAVVGEHGREIIDFAGGEQVIPNGPTERILAGYSTGSAARGGGSVVQFGDIIIHGTPQPGQVEQLKEAISEAVRNTNRREARDSLAARRVPVG